MKMRFLAVLLTGILFTAFCLSGCGKTETPAGETTESAAQTDAAEIGTDGQTTDGSDTEEAAVDGAAYGYAGTDPVEAAVYKYMAEEVSKSYDKADASIPTVTIIAEDYTKENQVTVYGDFWVDNYNIEGDTLKHASGGHYPAVMLLSKDGDNYTVTRMDVVSDGEEFDTSARELFGDHYDDFMKVYSDSDAREELRTITITDYVNLNGLPITQYQDEGWDPVKLIGK